MTKMNKKGCIPCNQNEAANSSIGSAVLLTTSQAIAPSFDGIIRIGLINRFRRKTRLSSYSKSSGDTVAYVVHNNKRYHGVSSKATPESLKERSLRIRQLWFAIIKRRVGWVPPKKNEPKHLGYTQSLSHAEANSLMRFYAKFKKGDKNHPLPETLTMRVDRRTCSICKKELPMLLKAMGIKQLNVVSGENNESITIYAK